VISLGSTEDAARAVAAAKAAFPEYSQTTPTERSALMARIFEAYKARYAEVAEACFIEAAGLEPALGSYSVKVQWNRSRHEMSYLDRITFNPEQCGGRPCIRGMRIRVKDVLDLLAAGVSEKEILEDYPDLEAEDIKACLQYAAAQADHAVLKVP
jgi:uncharacterized protein (DUF433 family)